MQKKSLLTVLLLLCLSLGSAWAQETVSLEEIEKGWKTKPIDNVANGSFGVML